MKKEIVVKCYDKFNQLLKEDDYVDVQKDGVQQIYKKEDGQLYFKPYGEEDRVSAYFSNDICKCDEVGNWITDDRYEDIKQETLEEFAERLCPNKEVEYDMIIEGAKWQQARSYSEKDMLATFHYGHQLGMNSVLAIQSQHSPQPIDKPNLEVLKKEWFGQFKK